MTRDQSALPDLSAYGAPAIRVVMMPKDTNALGTIFGGLILSYIDQAGAVEAHRLTNGRLVTVAVREVEFVAPVYVGDLVSFYARTVRRGTTSITVHVLVVADHRLRQQQKVVVTEADVVYVQVDDDGRPMPLPVDAPSDPIGGGPDDSGRSTG